MAQRPLGDFNILSPETPNSEGEQPSSAQKLPPEKTILRYWESALRDKRRAFLRASAKLNVEETE
jgi:hypothetical protein